MFNRFVVVSFSVLLTGIATTLCAAVDSAAVFPAQHPDTINDSPDSSFVGSATANGAADTASVLLADSAISDTAAADTVPHPQGDRTEPAKSGVKKLSLIKRSYRYRQQVLLATGMMAFVALMMLTSQSWNPE